MAGAEWGDGGIGSAVGSLEDPQNGLPLAFVKTRACHYIFGASGYRWYRLGCFLNHLVWFMPSLCPSHSNRLFLNPISHDFRPEKNTILPPKSERNTAVLWERFSPFSNHKPLGPSKQKGRSDWYSHIWTSIIYIYTHKIKVTNIIIVSPGFCRFCPSFFAPCRGESPWRGRSWPAASSASSRRSRCWRGCRWPRAASGALP